jgi:hypothetical protein
VHAVVSLHNVQWVPLSDGTASAPFTSMWPATEPFVIVTGADRQEPFGNVNGELDEHVDTADGLTVTDLVATLIVSVTLPLVAASAEPTGRAAIASAASQAKRNRRGTRPRQIPPTCLCLPTLPSCCFRSRC